MSTEMPMDFPWRAGMRDVGDHNVPYSRVFEVWPNGYPKRWMNEGEEGDRYTVSPEEAAEEWAGSIADLSDPATVGALAGAVREAWGDPRGYSVPLMNDVERRVIIARQAFDAATEALAWLAAWNARPR